MNMKYMVNEERLEGVMKKYLDEVYGDLTCEVTPDEVTWYKEGSPIAKVDNDDKNRLRLSESEFKTFMNVFGLPWKNNGDDDLPLKLIIPYLKFEGGSEAIPILQKLEFINHLTHIAVPSNWD